MKLVVIICLVAVAVATPLPRFNENHNDVQLLSYENDNIGLGNYKYSFSQSDGTKQEQQGELRNDNVLVVRGFYSWVSPNGHKYIVTYVADDNGYQADTEEAPGYDPTLVASLLG